MKRIVLCFDGTWNKPADEGLPLDEQVESNVVRFHRSIQDRGSDGNKQIAWYDRGVGSHWYDRFIGGATGLGLETNIVEGYRFLADEYDDGDEIYILGFSRGAYTARSLAGMLRNVGLVERSLATSFKIAMAYGIYRTRDDGPDSETARSFRRDHSREVKVTFLGVWDTVGALGIPLHHVRDINLRLYQFHDTKLGSIVESAYQAIAVDEHRQDYDICLWDPSERPQQTMEQRWFLGAHSDVGGGYRDRRLSDIPLRWMQEKAIAKGLTLERRELGDRGYLAPCTDSYMEFLGGLYSTLHRPYFRRVRSTPFGNEILDETIALRRNEDPTYLPQNEGF